MKMPRIMETETSRETSGRHQRTAIRRWIPSGVICGGRVKCVKLLDICVSIQNAKDRYHEVAVSSICAQMHRADIAAIRNRVGLRVGLAPTLWR